MIRPIVIFIVMTILAVTDTNRAASEPEPGKWTCKSLFGSENTLTIEGLTIKMPPNVEIDAALYLDGLQRRWVFGPEGNHQVIIGIDGTVGYYDFTDVKAGEQVEPNTILFCQTE